MRPTQIDTLRAALGEYTDSITYAAGYDPNYSEPDQALIDEAVAIAKVAEVAVVFAGLPGIYESEGFDREHMELPAQHDALIRAVAAANPRTVVVLANGAPVEMPWISDVDAVLEAYLGGQAAGGGIADVLMGKHNPSGKLAETFALQLADIPSQPWFPGANRQMHYREGLYIGYRYFDSAQRPVLFPFGHGLSYTEFALPSGDSVERHADWTGFGKTDRRGAKYRRCGRGRGGAGVSSYEAQCAAPARARVVRFCQGASRRRSQCFGGN